jgi:PAS domain S-box-containing protein
MTAQGDGENKRSEGQLRSFIRNAPISIAMFDKEMNYLAASTRWLTEYGRGRQDLIGLNHYQLYPDLPEWWKGVHRQALAGATLKNDEDLWIQPDGSQWWMRWTVQPWRDEAGAIGGLVISAVDITESKRAEQELRESEQKYSAIFETSPIATALTRMPEGITIEVNAAFLRLFEYERDEVLGKTSLELRLHDPAAKAQVRAALAERGSLRDFECTLATSSGARRVLLLNVDWVDIGGVKHVLTSARDVTERREAERALLDLDALGRLAAALRRSEYEQRLLAEAGAVWGSTLDSKETLKGIVKLAVRDFAEVCVVDLFREKSGIRRLEVASRDPSLAWACETLKKFPIDWSKPGVLSKAVNDGEPGRVYALTPETLLALAQTEEQVRVLRAFNIKSSLVVPLVTHGDWFGVLGFVSSSRVYGSEDLSLAQALAQRASLAIENARLYLVAQDALRTRDEVLGIVAHDLRNPLNAILMQSDLIKREGHEPERRPVEAIRRSASRMNRLIEDLLDITRMEAGRLTVERAPVSAGKALGEAVEAQRTLARANSIDLRLEAPSEPSEVWADRDRLLQVLENLIGNALKFTNAGGTVTVGAAPSGDKVLFWVKDTGVGIAAEHLPHLFERFWQASQRAGRGAGLGLQIVKGLVEVHGGRVWVESAPGKGSTFFFTLERAPRVESSLEGQPQGLTH